MLKLKFNKGISTPIGISIVLIIAIIIGGFTWYQYLRMPEERIKIADIFKQEETTEECQGLSDWEIQN